MAFWRVVSAGFERLDVRFGRRWVDALLLQILEPFKGLYWSDILNEWMYYYTHDHTYIHYLLLRYRRLEAEENHMSDRHCEAEIIYSTQ